MARKLYVHVGPRKTATSAIQYALTQHDNSVVIYPKVGLWRDYSHHGLVYKFFDEENFASGVEGTTEELFEKVGVETRGSDRNVVISSEALEFRDTGAFIRALLPYVSATPIEVEILVSCREHFARAASWYNQRVRALKVSEKRNPDKFLEAKAAEMCYAPLVRKLCQTGFPVTVMNYHPSENWLARFLMHLGFAQDQIPDNRSKLVSMSPKALIVGLAVNDAVRSKDTKRKILKAFGKMPNFRSSSKFIFGREASAIADRYFSVDRDFLLEEYGISLTPPDFASLENELRINSEDLADIAAVANGLGDPGQKIVKYARQYLAS